jgi:hypothetical protein
MCSKILLFILIVCNGGSAMALSPDPQLLSLVPPNAQVIAGLRVVRRSERHTSLLLINRENEYDLKDFRAVFGVDEAIRWHQLWMLGESNATGAAGQHSVLASGQFNSSLIFKSVVQNGATIDRYRGVTVLVLQPFARDPADLRITRWLAILGSRLAIFGSIDMVQEELDRHLAGTTASAVLTERLSHLRKDDDCWSAIEHFRSGERVKPALALLDSKFDSMKFDGDEFVMGARFGRQVEIEYEGFTRLQSANPTASASPVGLAPKTFLPRQKTKRGQDGGSAYVVVTQKRYDSWMSAMNAQKKLPRSPMHSPE